MNRYWTRIALGALLVFCVGLAGLYAVRRGKAEVKSLLTAAGTRIPLQLANLKFRLDGRGLGEISGIEVNRNGADDLGRVKMRVTLSDPAELDAVRDCGFTLDRGSTRQIDRMGFRCAEAAELESADFVKLGEVTFEPGNLTRPLYFPRDEVTRWRHSDVRSLDASLSRDGHGGVQAQGVFDLQGHSGPGQRGSFSLKADPGGAVISVRDDRGRSLVDFSAGDNGVRLNIRDRQGRNLIKMLADSVGAALRVRN